MSGSPSFLRYYEAKRSAFYLKQILDHLLPSNFLQSYDFKTQEDTLEEQGILKPRVKLYLFRGCASEVKPQYLGKWPIALSVLKCKKRAKLRVNIFSPRKSIAELSSIYKQLRQLSSKGDAREGAAANFGLSSAGDAQMRLSMFTELERTLPEWLRIAWLSLEIMAMAALVFSYTLRTHTPLLSKICRYSHFYPPFAIQTFRFSPPSQESL